MATKCNANFKFKNRFCASVARGLTEMQRDAVSFLNRRWQCRALIRKVLENWRKPSAFDDAGNAKQKQVFEKSNQRDAVSFWRRWHKPGLYSSWNKPTRRRQLLTPLAYARLFTVPVTLQRDARRRISRWLCRALKQRSCKQPTRRRQLVFDWEIRLLQGSSYKI